MILLMVMLLAVIFITLERGHWWKKEFSFSVPGCKSARVQGMWCSAEQLSAGEQSVFRWLVVVVRISSATTAASMKGKTFRKTLPPQLLASLVHQVQWQQLSRRFKPNRDNGGTRDLIQSCAPCFGCGPE
ncbi:unnamed protein product [Symbiodinium sp. CCMP2592]|nr:unnamed protein product [Symbiodinium sp. CCMP2592]